MRQDGFPVFLSHCLFFNRYPVAPGGCFLVSVKAMLGRKKGCLIRQAVRSIGPGQRPPRGPSCPPRTGTCSHRAAPFTPRTSTLPGDVCLAGHHGSSAPKLGCPTTPHPHVWMPKPQHAFDSLCNHHHGQVPRHCLGHTRNSNTLSGGIASLGLGERARSRQPCPPHPRWLGPAASALKHRSSRHPAALTGFITAAVACFLGPTRLLDL